LFGFGAVVIDVDMHARMDHGSFSAESLPGYCLADGLPAPACGFLPPAHFWNFCVGTWPLCVWVGTAGVFVVAAQIYGSTLLGRKMVSSGFYRYIRHPQYLCVWLSPFGLFTAWPRMIIFLLVVEMLFGHYFLARVEERRMLACDASYSGYMRRTGMFLPGNPGGRVYRLVFGGLPNQRFAHRLALASLLALSLLLGFGLRAYTVRHIASIAVSPDMAIVSVYPMTSTATQELAALAVSDPSVEQALRREGQAVFVGHILPHDYGMISMFADTGTRQMAPRNIGLSRFRYLSGWLLPFFDSHIRKDLMGSDGEEYRVVFSRVDGPKGQPVAESQLFDLSAKMTPVYIADVNAATRQVGRTIDPPRRSFWGDVKKPIF
jgi:hypothetical protein